MFASNINVVFRFNKSLNFENQPNDSEKLKKKIEKKKY